MAQIDLSAGFVPKQPQLPPPGTPQGVTPSGVTGPNGVTVPHVFHPASNATVRPTLATSGQPAIAPVGVPQESTDRIDLSGGFVPKTNSGQPTTPPEEDKPGLLERAYETSGLKSIIDKAKAQSDADEAASKEIAGHLKAGRWGHAAEALLKHVAPSATELLGPAGEFLSGVAQNTYEHGKQAVHAISQGNVKEAIAQGAEAVPVLGSIAEQVGEPLGKDLREKNYSGVAGDVTGGAASLALLKGGPKAAEGVANAAEDAARVIPKEPVIAGTKLPETVGQAAARANPTGIGSDVKGLEDVTTKLPGSGRLRKIGEDQQTATREILADKAAKTGAETSKAPESIEKNAAAAAAKAREAGVAKYQAIGEAAKDADLSKPVTAAHDILGDETISKVLPKSAKDALGKVGASLDEREAISKQIYGKKFNDLEPAKQSEVTKALSGSTESASDFEAVQKARSEIADAAHGMKDPADRFQMHKALDSFDQAIEDSLKAHDAKTGTNLSGELAEAKKLWSQKYAFEEFRDGLQDLMRDQPHSGRRVVNGAAFQKLINDLDPRGSTGKTTLQRMFPDDPKSVADLHELADFMGKNQAHAGGMTTGMAKLRMLGLKESALGLMANGAGFSLLMSKPGLARAALTAFKGGFRGARLAGAISQLNQAADENKPTSQADTERSTLATDLPTDSSTPTITRTNTPTIATNAKTATTNSTNPIANPKANSIPNSIAPSRPNATPPTTLWQGKENKRLTLEGPDGKPQRWELRNGQPRRID